MIPYGSCLKRVSTSPLAKTLYLTFDDGPHPPFTEKVLEALSRFHAKATFFVIAEKACLNLNTIRAIQAEGHCIGNHSWDHTFGPYFSRRQTLLNWIEKAQTQLEDLLGEVPIGFRSPAGVRTPPLHWALYRLQIPLIHWNRRFYDTTFTWTKQRALSSLNHSQSGSILLLHDNQKEPLRQTRFLETLHSYLEKAQNEGFSFAPLDPDVVWSSLDS